MKKGKTVQASILFLFLAVALIGFSSASTNCSSSQYNWSSVSSNVCDYGVNLDNFANGRTPCKEPNPAVYAGGVLVSSSTCNSTYIKQQETLNCLFALSDNSYVFNDEANPKVAYTLNGLTNFTINGQNCQVIASASAYRPYYACGNLQKQYCYLPDAFNYVEGGNEYFSTFMVNITCNHTNTRYSWNVGYTQFNVSNRSFSWNPVDESWGAASFGYNNTRFLQQACSLPNVTNPLPNCTSFSYSNWSSCNNNIQTRGVLTSLPANCTGGNPVLSQSCTINAPTCTSFTYSNWSGCSNNQQTRTVLAFFPTNCSDGNPVLSQSCTNGNNTNQTNVTGFVPVVSIISPLNGATYNATQILLNVTSNQIVNNLFYSLDGGINTSFNVGNFLTGLVNGTHSLLVYANNANGTGVGLSNFNILASNSGNNTNPGNNTNQTNVTGQSPLVVLSSPLNLTYNSSSVLLNATSDQLINNWFFNLDGGLNVSFALGGSLINLVNGTHNITIYANNANGTGSAFVVFSTYSSNTNGDLPNTIIDNGSSDDNSNSGNYNGPTVFTNTDLSSSASSSSSNSSNYISLEDATTSNSVKNNYMWLIIPSLILAVLILAVLIVKLRKESN